MTLDEILDGYEDVWRAATLDGKPQAHSLGDLVGGWRGTCALACAPESLWRPAAEFVLSWEWVCPECGHRPVVLGMAMVHFNDNHGWTWDMFANKFRDVLQRGAQRPAAGGPQ